jgi:cell division transport system permease protein
MGRILFFFSEAFRALRRNGAPTLAAVITTVVTVVLLGVLIPVFQTAQAKSDEVNSQLAVHFGIYDGSTNAEVAAAKAKIEAVPGVDSVTYVSKSEALKSLKSELQDKSIVEELHSNPLPASFEVKASDSQDLTRIEEEVMGKSGPGAKSNPISPAIANPFRGQQSTEKIAEVTSALKVVLTVLMALLIAASLLLIGNTIRLSIFTRRREVEVMRLVGATRWFIRWPFLIEGVVVGFLGGLVAILILWIGKITIVDPLSDHGDAFALAQHNSTIAFPALIAILFAASILVSTIGSGITLRRFLRV